jgi:integrase
MPIHKRSGRVAAGVVSDEMLVVPAVISSPAVKRTVHKLMDGDLQLFQKPTSCFWQCAATVGGKQFRYSTKKESFAEAQDVAKDWFLSMSGKARAGLITAEKTFQTAAERFTLEYGMITDGQRAVRWVEGHQIRLRLHLLPFFGHLGLSGVTPSQVQDYRMHRITTTIAVAEKAGKVGKAPARSTIHDEIGTLRLVLKTGIRHGWLAHLPDLSPPYKTSGKIVHRPWFSPAEYKQLYTATRAYAKDPAQPQYQWNADQLHDYVLFMGNTGMRPDEAGNLQHRDVTVVTDPGSVQEILEIEVRGKRGIGFCKSTTGAVRPYQRLLYRPKPKRGMQTRNRSKLNPNPVLPDELPQPTDKVFPGSYLKLFNRILNENNLKVDRDGKPRTAYSLRHTYICLRLMEGADIYQIAKNCRTSVEMIEKFYAAHIKNTLDASAINVMRSRGARGGGGKPAADGAAKPGAGKTAAMKLTDAEKADRKERGRRAARGNADDPTVL